MPEALREAAARRGFGLLAALVLEALLILLVLTLGRPRRRPTPRKQWAERRLSLDVSHLTR